MTEPKIDLTTNVVSAGQASVRVPPTIAELMVVLLKAAPGYITMDRIHSKLYGHRDNPAADATVRVHLSRANAFLRPIGFRIENVRALGWRLARDADANPTVSFEAHEAVCAERDAALQEVQRLQSLVAAHKNIRNASAIGS